MFHVVAKSALIFVQEDTWDNLQFFFCRPCKGRRVASRLCGYMDHRPACQFRHVSVALDLPGYLPGVTGGQYKHSALARVMHRNFV